MITGSRDHTFVMTTYTLFHLLGETAKQAVAYMEKTNDQHLSAEWAQHDAAKAFLNAAFQDGIGNAVLEET